MRNGQRVPDGQPTRRTLLAGVAGGAAALALGGCWPRKNPPPARPAPHPLTPVVAGTQALVDRYLATTSAYPDLGTRLQPLLAEHLAHLDALRGAMGMPSPTASAAPSASASVSVPPGQAAALAALHAAEQAGAADATSACLAAVAEYAPLLGSIAACRATHVEVLT